MTGGDVGYVDQAEVVILRKVDKLDGAQFLLDGRIPPGVYGPRIHYIY
jgi:hypothetical protein